MASIAKKKASGMSDKTSDIILVAICVVVLLIVAYPLYYVLIASFSDPYQVYAGKTFLSQAGLPWTATRRCSLRNPLSPPFSTR